jgi:protein tyrosine phosphatase
MKSILLILLVSFIFTSVLRIQVKTKEDIPKLMSFGNTKSLKIESMLPETKVERKMTPVLEELERYFYVILDNETKVRELQQDLLKKDFINAAFYSADAQLPYIKQQTPSYQNTQRYLNQSIDGVDMYYAFNMNGGRGLFVL